MKQIELKMMYEPKPGRKLRFKTGVIMIVISYIFWGAMFVFAALALHKTGLPWWSVASGAFALSWIFFIAGLLLAGMEAVHIVRHRILMFFKYKKGNR